MVQMSDNIWRVRALALNGPFYIAINIPEQQARKYSVEYLERYPELPLRLYQGNEIVASRLDDPVAWRIAKMRRSQQNQMQFPGINSMMICDCGNHNFKIGTGRSGGQ